MVMSMKVNTNLIIVMDGAYIVGMMVGSMMDNSRKIRDMDMVSLRGLMVQSMMVNLITVNDTVMGGVSQGEVIYESDSMVFEGYVSTDSNGGFASVRSPDDVLDLSGYDDLYIRMKSEGQPFSLVLSHTDVWYEGSYRYDITGASDEWQTFVFPLENFQLYEFNGGYPTATGEWMQPADRSEIFHLELMSKLFEDGDFRLEVDYIAFD